jgi:membrane associated rhomboid family serine protease
LLPLKDNIPTRVFPVVTVVIILINVVVYFGVEQGRFSDVKNQNAVIELSFIPYELSHQGQECAQIGDQIGCGTKRQLVRAGAQDVEQPNVFLTIFTAMFMHGSFLHIAGNMLFLWIFGNNIEDSMGRLKYLLFYLGGGVVAAVAQFAIDTSSATPTLGASGAVAAVLGGYALLYPRARVITLIFIIFFITVIELPALAVLGVWFILQLVDAGSQTAGGGGAGVAYFAHIGGFLFGLLFVKLLASRYDPNYDRHNRIPVY